MAFQADSLAGLAHKVAAAPQPDFWIWTGLCTLAASLGFYFAFRYLHRARIIEDTPTSKVRSATQGYVELSGTGEFLDGMPIRAPLTGTECTWYHFKVEKRADKNWRTVENGTSGKLFLLRDDTGECVVDPEGAEVTTSIKEVWYGASTRPPKGPGITATSPFRLLGSGSYRYTEQRMHPGNALYALGFFKTHNDLHLGSGRAEAVRDLLRVWKRDTAALLARFDANRDGQIDPVEWEAAQRAARDQVEEDLREQAKRPPLHSLSRTLSRRRPYLLSTHPQTGLARRYKLYAGVALAAFFVFGTVAVWLLNVRFAG